MNVTVSSKGYRLPLAFRPLDMGARTKLVPRTMRLAHHDRMTIRSCGSCSCLRLADSDDDDDGALEHACRTRSADCARDRAFSECEVKDVLHVPVVSAAAETTIAVVRPYLELQRPLDVIPILDRRARPIGTVGCAELRRRIAKGIDQNTLLASLMTAYVPRVLPCTLLAEAARLRRNVGFGGVAVVDVHGSLLGLVAARDLVLH